MQAIAITGASGFIGRQLVKRLSLCSDLQLRLLVRRGSIIFQEESENISIYQGDLLDSEALGGFLEPSCIVINLAYLSRSSPEENFTAINNLMEVCSNTKIKRLIHCSTAVVAGRAATDRVTENTPKKPLQEYESTKSKIEEIILGKSAGIFETVILRPTAVFGKDGKNLVKLMDSLMNGNRLINYLKSCIYQYRRMNLVYVDNVVAAIEFLMRTDRNLNGEIFIISDDDDPSNNYRDLEKYLIKRMGCREYPIAPVSLPFPILRFLLRLAGRTNDNPALVYDCGKLLSTGFKKPLSLKEGLSRFSDWYIKTHRPDKQHQ